MASSNFHSEMQDGGAPMLVDYIGEAVTYNPASTARAINAIVHRNPIEALPETPDLVGIAFVVKVIDDDTLGISAAELNKGSDTISVAVREGGTPETRQITRLIESGGGMLTLGVR
jgi:hypothetical protein